MPDINFSQKLKKQYFLYRKNSNNERYSLGLTIIVIFTFFQIVVLKMWEYIGLGNEINTLIELAQAWFCAVLYLAFGFAFFYYPAKIVVELLGFLFFICKKRNKK